MGAGLIALGGELIKSFFGDWIAARQNKRAIADAVAKNKIRLAESAQAFNQSWQMAALEGKDDVLRRLSFVIWTLPLVWGYFSPESMHAYFVTLGQVLPDWYIRGFLGMNAAIWGILSLKNVRGALTKQPEADAPPARASGAG